MKRVFVDNSVLLRCYYSFVFPIIEFCSSAWGPAAECHLQLLERQVYSVARLCLIGLPCHCVIDVMLLHCIYCTRLNLTLIIVCSVSLHLLLSEFDMLELRVLEFEVSRCRTSQFAGISCRQRLVCEMSFPTLCLTLER